jgi:hypothetical protein
MADEAAGPTDAGTDAMAIYFVAAVRALEDNLAVVLTRDGNPHPLSALTNVLTRQMIAQLRRGIDLARPADAGASVDPRPNRPA